MFKSKNIKDFVEAQSILEDGVTNFYSGKTYSYKAVSTELRKLLCDTQGKKDISIFARMFPGVQLRPLSGYSLPESLKDGLVFSLPLESNYDGKGGIRASLVVENQFIYRNQWLDQSIAVPDLTIRKLIRSTSDKEGAHSDTDIEVIVQSINAIKIGKEDTYKYLIVAIGEYIGGVCNEIIEKQKLRERFSFLFGSNY
jgi:hypothetical protein